MPSTLVAFKITSALISKARKAAVIEKLFRGKTDDVFVNFLLVLNDHNRLDILRPVAAMFRELRDEWHKRVRVLALNGPSGAGAARNAALAAARGRWIAILDGDDIWPPDGLATAVAFLDTHADCGFVTRTYKAGRSRFHAKNQKRRIGQANFIGMVWIRASS